MHQSAKDLLKLLTIECNYFILASIHTYDIRIVIIYTALFFFFISMNVNRYASFPSFWVINMLHEHICSPVIIMFFVEFY